MKKKRGRMTMSKKEKPVDNVNHPKHYADGCCVECIDAMILTWGFHYTSVHCQITAFKYLWRYKNKNGEEDLNKAEWYLNKSDALNELGNRDEQITEKNLQLSAMLDKARETYDLY